MKIASKSRRIIVGFATGLILLAATVAANPKTQPNDEPISFFLIGDTHILANKKDSDTLDNHSATLTTRLVDTLNRLGGTEIPKEAGGGVVAAPRGVIHAGDCIDTGDQANVQAQRTEWAAFVGEFGLTGMDGRLKLPIYEVHGNHDSPRGDGLAVQKIIERNKARPAVTNLSKSGLHYSWDWGNVHFVNLGIVVGQVDDVKRKRRYASLGSLDFLISDLKEKVGKSGRPIVLTHHVDMLRYAQTLPVDDKKAEGMEWDPADVKAFYEALRGYKVAAILYGHTHARNIFRWNGSAKAAKEGIPVFNVAKSGHFASKSQAFLHLEIRGEVVTAREFQTADSWATGSWTPRAWTAPIGKVGE